MLNKLPPGVCWRGGGGGGGATGLLNKGGGSNRLPALVTKQQTVEFPQVLTSSVLLSQFQYKILMNQYSWRHCEEDDKLHLRMEMDN